MSSKVSSKIASKKPAAPDAKAKVVVSPAAKGGAKAPVKSAPVKSAPVKESAAKAPTKGSSPKAAPAVAKTPAKSASPLASKVVSKVPSKVTAPPAAKPVAKVTLVKGGASKASPVVSGKGKASPAVVATAPAPVAAKPVASPDAKSPRIEIGNTDSPQLLKTYKLLRTSFFFEVVEAEERNNKKKYSSDAKVPEKPTICVRNRSSLVEETPEELIERLAQELEEENFGMLREFGQQLCTKCGVNTISMEFRVDKDLGYCEECADLLRLGQSKEARKSDYQLSLNRRDPLASDGDDDIEGGAVDEDELEELEED